MWAACGGRHLKHCKERVEEILEWRVLPIPEKMHAKNGVYARDQKHNEQGVDDRDEGRCEGVDDTSLRTETAKKAQDAKSPGAEWEGVR